MKKDFWERIDRLEELAKKATQGKWNYCGCEIWANETTMSHDVVGKVEKFEDAQYIDAANPAMILEMIAEMRRLEKEADWLAKMCRGFCDGHNYCNECVHYPRGCPISKEIEYRFDKHEVEDWRKAARKSVSENNNA